MKIDFQQLKIQLKLVLKHKVNLDKRLKIDIYRHKALEGSHLILYSRKKGTHKSELQRMILV